MQTEKDGSLFDGSEDKIRAWSRKKKLIIWVHNRLKTQKGITEFWNIVPVLPVVAAEVHVGLGLGLDVGLEPGRGGQIPSDLPNL